MTARHKPTALIGRAEIVEPPDPRACPDHTFELPPILYVATALLFLGFVGVLSFASRSPGMVVPFGIFIAFIAAFFTVPTLWVRMKPAENSSRALRWDEFINKGIMTPCGRASGRDSAILVLLLPVVIFCWALAVAIIAGIVAS